MLAVGSTAAPRNVTALFIGCGLPTVPDGEEENEEDEEEGKGEEGVPERAAGKEGREGGGGVEKGLWSSRGRARLLMYWLVESRKASSCCSVCCSMLQRVLQCVAVS